MLSDIQENLWIYLLDQVIIAQWVGWQLATGEVPGSNPGKGENLLISDLKGNLFNSNLNTIIVWMGL